MNVIIRPIITEKTMRIVPDNKYTFEISSLTNKLSVTKEIKRIYKVDVVDVNIINIKGKKKIFRRIPGKRSDYKKAIITIKKDQKIPGFETPNK